MTVRLGIDWTGTSLRIVRPRSDESLVSFDLFTQLNTELLEVQPPDDLTIGLSLPDVETLITTVVLPDMTDWQRRAVFELSQSVLEPIDTYRVVLEQSPLANQILAALVRKSHLADLSTRLGLNGTRDRVGIVPRALSLAAGFRAFCSRPPADLLCLVDIADGVATVCLTYRDRPVSFGALSVVDVAVDSSAGSRFAVDLRTWVNVRLGSLVTQGLSESLGAVVVSGESGTELLLAELTKQFLCPVASAAWLPDRAPLDADGRALADGYLVALGTLAK